MRPWNGWNVSPTAIPSLRAAKLPITASFAEGSKALPDDREKCLPGAYSTSVKNSGIVPTIR
jgi:hypothetical protein